MTMKPIIKVNNSELSFRLKLNYNNVYSRLRMLLGKSANLFADISTKYTTTTWYADDDAEYAALSDAPKSEIRDIMVSLSQVLKAVKKEIDKSQELAPYADDIMEVPDNNFVFYRKADDGYKFVLAGWGCKQAHAGVSETVGLIKRVSKTVGIDEEISTSGRTIDIEDLTDDVSTLDEINKEEDGLPNKPQTPPVVPPTPPVKKTSDNTDPEEEKQNTPKKKKEQHVLLKVINQNNKPVEDEDVMIRTQNGESNGVTDENGIVEVGNLPYYSTFSVSFPDIPNIQERAYEVEPKVEMYEAYIKKYVSYSPVLFVEDQNGNVVDNYNIRLVIGGVDSILNTGANGMIQLPTMQEGQKFIVIDSANYANSEEYSVTPETVKKPFRFTIKRALKSKIGITILNKERKPIEGATVNVRAGDNPCQQTTDKYGRAEFPSEIFTPGEIDVELYVPGKGKINSKLNFVPETTEYSIQLTGKKSNGGFNWKWLLLLPLLLLFGFGGKFLYDKLQENDTPTIAEMESGVVMIIGQGRFYADLNIPDLYYNGKRLEKAWFNYDEQGKLVGYTYNEQDARPLEWSGTGFLISDDGLIATNKHVVDPAPEEDLIKLLRHSMQNEKDDYQTMCDRLNDKLQILGAYGALNQEYINTRDSLQKCQNMVRILDKILNTGDFKVNKEIRTFAAFTGTRVEFYDNLVSLSKPRAVGEPGGVTENDLAIVQISKKQDVPTDAFVFTVPEVDLMDQEIPDSYDITVLGYNAGPGLQVLKHQDAIKPQAQHGKISNLSQKYRIGYDAPTLGGSSGSPVVNNQGELIAINNSGIQGTQGFNYGVRTKYLKELLDGLKSSNNKGYGDSKDVKEKRKNR